MQALCYEVRAAIQDPNYPRKAGDGEAGFGPEPARYALAVELHDMHSERHWKQNVRNMQRYFEGILGAQGI
jgi:hypothetical protein